MDRPTRSCSADARVLRGLLAGGLLAALAMVLLMALLPAPVLAADIGFAGPSLQGAGAATGEKPESKLWWNDGRWWASMYDSGGGTYRIWWLDRPNKTWVNSGVALDNRPASRADTLWDGTHLYVASAVFASSNTTVSSGVPTRLYRYSYSPLTRTYTKDAGFPVNINNTSSETITLEKDTNSRLWATWSQGQSVYYNATTGPGQDTSWGTPAVLPVGNATSLDPDDISTLVAFGTPTSAGGAGGQVGVMWSNHTASTTYFAIHNDNDPVGTWGASQAVTIPGPKQSDDHLNIKNLQTDDRGRVFAVIKTSLDELASAGSSAPQIVVLARGTTGGWSRATFGTVADCHTRPVLVLDAPNKRVHVYATAPESGCPFSGTAGSIFEKTSALDNLAFPAGRGTAIMRASASPNLNNVTATKQTVDSASGIVLLAGDGVAKRYWTSDESVPAAAPLASFTASPLSGQAPLAVTFTDTSTGSPTSWAWDFGDGASSATQNTQHTYATAGTYTATLTASNSGGPSAPATRTITITAPPPPPPTASFTASPLSGEAPLAVTFTDTSTGSPTSWAWDFGDGASATGQNPQHTYATAGTYTATLTASNGSGPSAPATKTITITAPPPAPPTASFTASPLSGQAPLAVTFTDTSTGSPTSWAWDFGDGASATGQNPQHTYATAGTYTATLTASNSSGPSAPATKTITITAPPEITVIGSKSGVSSTAVQSVDLQPPSGVSAGDVLVATFTVNNNPTVTVPTGWTALFPALKPDAAATVYAYYHIVTIGEIFASYSWTLASLQKWGGGITAYRGVDQSRPVDVVSPATKIDGTGTGTSITLSGVSTVTNGAMLIGGLGADGASVVTTQPSGWSEGFDSLGGKMSEHAYKRQPAAGPSGSATWTLASGRAMAVWMTALRRAG